MNLFEAIRDNHTKSQSTDIVWVNKLISEALTDRPPFMASGELRINHWQTAIILTNHGRYQNCLTPQELDQFIMLLEKARRSLIASSNTTPITDKLVDQVRHHQLPIQF